MIICQPQPVTLDIGHIQSVLRKEKNKNIIDYIITYTTGDAHHVHECIIVVWLSIRVSSSSSRLYGIAQFEDVEYCPDENGVSGLLGWCFIGDVGALPSTTSAACSISGTLSTAARRYHYFSLCSIDVHFFLSSLQLSPFQTFSKFRRVRNTCSWF